MHLNFSKRHFKNPLHFCYLNLSAGKFSNLEMTNVAFEFCNFTGSRFNRIYSGTELVFRNSILTKVKISDSYISDVKYLLSVLDGMSFSGSHVWGKLKRCKANRVMEDSNIYLDYDWDSLPGVLSGY